MPAKGAALTLRVTQNIKGEVSFWPNPDSPIGGNIVVQADDLIQALKQEGVL